MSTIRRRKQAVVKADTLEALLDGPPVPDSPEVKRLRVAMFAANYNIPLVDAPRAMRGRLTTNGACVGTARRAQPMERRNDDIDHRWQPQGSSGEGVVRASRNTPEQDWPTRQRRGSGRAHGQAHHQVCVRVRASE
jgi:hypothetical protein